MILCNAIVADGGAEVASCELSVLLHTECILCGTVSTCDNGS
jgi:hypothetical protein